MTRPLTATDVLDDIEFELLQGSVSRHDLGAGIQAARQFHNKLRGELLDPRQNPPGLRDVISRQAQLNDMLLLLLQQTAAELAATQQQLRALGKASVGSLEALQMAQPLVSAPAASLPDDVMLALAHPIVYVELDARPSRIPVIGPLITRLRIALHRIALHYVRLYAGKQNSLNAVYSQALRRMRDSSE